MKKLTFLFLLALITSSIGQNFVMKTPSDFLSQSAEDDYVYGAGGYNLPSVGNLHILIIFAEFPDDNYDIYNSRWQKGSAPQNMSAWIDQSWSANPTQGSLTHYFNLMSHNNLHLTGKTIHVTAPKTRLQYRTLGWERGDVHKEILQQIDAAESFADYDKWTSSAYSHSNVSDGKVDMVAFVWRNVYMDDIGVSNFNVSYGSLSWTNPETITVDGGLRTINMWDSGSGITVSAYMGNKQPYDNNPFRIFIHEFAHYLLGHNDMHNGYGFWGMLCDWGSRSYVANAFERYQLGWIDNPGDYTINANTENNNTYSARTLEDFATTSRAYRITVNATTNEYFYLENHQNTSYWETHAPFSDHPNSIDGIVEPGLYVVRQIGIANTPSSTVPGDWTKYAKELIPAEGRYTWNVIQSLLNPFGGSRVYPVWYKGTPSLSVGYNDLELVTHSYIYSQIQNPSNITFLRDTTNHTYIYSNHYLGDNKDVFRIGYNQVFSPWSNPNNQRASNSTTRFGFELNSVSNGICTMALFVNTSAEASPSKPQNLKLSANPGNNRVRLTWDANTEPDISSYEIYRKVNYSGWGYLATTSNNFYVDTQWQYDQGSTFDVKYKIVVKDNTNKTSVFSDEVTCHPWPMGKRAAELVSTDIPIAYSLSNYPNPFNPSTKISFSLPQAGHVTLKVYDVLGREVAELVNGVKEKGKHSVMFNANKNASGFYVYTIKVNDFFASKKMLLTK